MKRILLNIIGTILVLVAAYFFGMVAMLLNIVTVNLTSLTVLGFLWLPILSIPLMWMKSKSTALKVCCAVFSLCLLSCAAEGLYRMHQKSITINTTYKNNAGAIGFSFRYYLDTLIANPDVKMLSVNGVYPSVENIKSGAYAIVTPLYAVTYRECENENVSRLIDWILSDEGQFIIEETGYSGVR